MKIKRASETTGPLGATIEVDRSHEGAAPLRVSVSGDIDLFSAPRLRAALFDLIRRGTGEIVLDLGQVQFCDSSALRVFVDAQRATASRGRTLAIENPSTTIRHLFDVSGLRGVLLVR